ncbi:MAG TPA: hypothetical protein PL000_23210 [Anaerolineales bacterium]|jgi:hypothetical protein|nr:hypothetical protein [Anaerolineales bacterium]
MTNSTFVAAQDLPQVFAGYSFRLSDMKVILTDGTALRRSQFKVLFGGLTFALDRNNEKITRDAWRAFIDNAAFRPPIVYK